MAHEIIHDTGDAIVAIREGVDVASKTVELADVMSGKVPGRRSADDIIFYKSVGTALQDVVTAEMLLRGALQKQQYVPMPAGVVTITR
jgi:ornithine cyclodeaminase/alanine dehydrogenase-like protein (mu-crystallin family)